MTKDRVDQDLSAGNRGYIQGRSLASVEPVEKKTTRTIQAVEIELRSPIKFEKAPKRGVVTTTPLARTEDTEIWGNRGYISQGQVPAVTQREPAVGNFEKYTVQKGDTLQKISNKFFGTTKKWLKIYEANRDTLKSPNKIYPGQDINIPVEPLKQTKENLK
jgi:nucleoid-associated protein YgaU